MPTERSEALGLKRLIAKYRSDFRIPENLQHYSRKDYLSAEKKYLHFRLNNGHSSSELRSD